MKTVLMTILAITGTAGAAQASGSASRATVSSRTSIATRACERSDREGFCGLTSVHGVRTPAVVPATLNDQGRAQLDRLIASLH